MTVHTSWHGDEIKVRTERAIGRADISISEQISAEAKVIVHKLTGTLARSIHVAVPEELHFDDQDRAAAGEDLSEGGLGPIGGPAGGDSTRAFGRLTHDQVVNDMVALTEVGSWIAYACVEETGRQHFYMSPAYEMVAPTGVLTIEAAFAEEGL